MVEKKRCFKELVEDGKMCIALKEKKCTNNCPCRVTDFNEFIETLESIMVYAYNRKDKSSISHLFKTLNRWMVKAYKYAGEEMPPGEVWDKLYGISEAYIEDTKRGEKRGKAKKGGKREDVSRNKDNRHVKLTKEEERLILDQYKEFEEKTGKLERIITVR